MLIKQSQNKLPAIFCDIDGVLKIRNSPLPRVPEAIKILRKDLSQLDIKKYGENNNQKLPLFFLTNRGCISKEQQINLINKAMGFQEFQRDLHFDPQQIILNYCAFEQELQNFQDKLILLIVGEGDQEGKNNGIEVIEKFGHNKYITVEEYIDIHPEMHPLRKRSLNNQELKQKLIKRLNLPQDYNFETLFQIHAIFIMAYPRYWEENIQLILDLVSTEDGNIAKTLPSKPLQSHIPIYCGYGDLVYKDEFQLLRISNGGFIEALKLCHKQLYKNELEVIMYGKPQKRQFQYAEEYARKMCEGICDISKFYMIGDNPKSDIKGANSIGWESILVRSGVFQGKNNDEENPAKYVVDDLYDAVKLIFQLEDINYNQF